MGTIGTLILIAVIFFLGKFIYDSYLTDNTERRWEEFKASDPKTASRVEGSFRGNIKIDHKKNEWLNNRHKIFKDALSQLRFQAEKIKRENIGLDHISFLLLLTDSISKYSEIIITSFAQKSNEIGLSPRTIKETVENATRRVLEEYSGLDLGGRTFEDKSQENIKLPVSEWTAKLILRERPFLKEGMNRKIKIYKIEPMKLSNELMPKGEKLPADELDCFVVYLEAMDEDCKQKAKEFFKIGDYQNAVDQRAITIVEPFVAEQLMEMKREYLDLECKSKGKSINGKPNFEIVNLFPSSS